MTDEMEEEPRGRRSRKKQSPNQPAGIRAWASAALGALVLVLCGFMLGLGLGVLSEEPQMVASHLAGGSEEVVLVGAMADPSGDIEISVVCAPEQWAGDLAAVHREFREQLLRTGRRAEFLYVLNGPRQSAEESLSRLEEDHFEVRVLRLARGFDEAAALQHAFDRARGRYVLTIPDRFQIDPSVIVEVLAGLDNGDEVVVTRREPRCDALFNRLQSKIFHAFVRRIYGQRFRDLARLSGGRGGRGLPEGSGRRRGGPRRFRLRALKGTPLCRAGIRSTARVRGCAVAVGVSRIIRANV